MKCCRVIRIPILLVVVVVVMATSNVMAKEEKEASLSPLGVVSIKRGIDTDLLLNAQVQKCNFTGTIVLGGPFSLEQEDKFFKIGSRQLVSYQLVVDYVNRFNCGVSLPSSGNYALELRSYDDQSSVEWTTAIANKLVNTDQIDILLGGYSSTLTKPLAEVAHNTSRLLMSPGAASTPVFAGKPQVFGTFPPSSKYLSAAIEGLAKVGAKSIATVYEGAAFTRGVCGAGPDLAKKYAMQVTSTQGVTSSPNTTILEPVAEKLSEEDPDIVVTCVYDCVPWMQAMRNVNWSPKAQVFTVCVGLNDFTAEMGTDAEYIMGANIWDASLNTQDVVTGWSARHFADILKAETSDIDITYHSASAAGVMSIIVQALQEVDSMDETKLAEYIASHSFETMYGVISFDGNGQSQAPSLLIQYDTNLTVQTIFPEATSSGPILYPMPSWDRRDCIRISECVVLGNICNDDGQCICDDPEHWYAVGSGSTAQCVPIENMNYIHFVIHAICYLFVAIVLLMAVGALIWLYYYRNNTLVNVSQPIFLFLIIAGSIISILAIIPMASQTGYRDSEDIHLVDAACMAVPWLWGIGFALTFSALFAKVRRVKKLYGAATNMRRQMVQAKEVYFIVAVFVALEVAFLLTFQFISPLQWERHVTKDIDGFPVESVGACESEYGWWMLLALVAGNIISLVYALVLCWQTKDIPSNFAESNHIFLAVMFLFQILVLAVPVSAMVREVSNVFFFMRAGAIFFQNLSVLTLIFVPKMIRVYKGEDTLEQLQNTFRQTNKLRRRSISGLNENSAGLDYNNTSQVSVVGPPSTEPLSGEMNANDSPVDKVSGKSKKNPGGLRKIVSFADESDVEDSFREHFPVHNEAGDKSSRTADRSDSATDSPMIDAKKALASETLDDPETWCGAGQASSCRTHSNSQPLSNDEMSMEEDIEC